MPNPIRRRRLYGGKVYPMLASQHVAASTQFWSVANNPSVQMGAGVDMTLAGWVWLDATASNPGIIGMWSQFDGNRDYLLFLASATPTFRFQVTTAGSSTAPALVNSAAVTTGQWYFVVGRYDGSNVGLSVNNGAFVNTAYSGDIHAGNDALNLGKGNAVGALSGRLDSWGLWKSARGAGGALSAAQLTTLFSGNVGMAYQDLTADLKTALVSWYNFDGNGNDSFGTNNLTNNNAVTFTTGKR